MCFMLVSHCVLFFFFKQKTSYELRICDWSSDVCSSDLQLVRRDTRHARARSVSFWWFRLHDHGRRCAAHRQGELAWCVLVEEQLVLHAREGQSHAAAAVQAQAHRESAADRKSTRLNSSH